MATIGLAVFLACVFAVSGKFSLINTNRNGSGQQALMANNLRVINFFSLCVIHKEGVCPSSGDILMYCKADDNEDDIFFSEVKQHWSVIGWVTKNLLFRAPTCFERHVKPLVPAAFTVVSIHQSARVVGYSQFSLCVIHKEGLCPNSGDFNRLMMMKMIILNPIIVTKIHSIA
jgi:hypothetical protein